MRIEQNILLLFERMLNGFRRRLRNYYYLHVLKKMGKGCQICNGVLITGHENISLGNQVTVNDGVILQSCQGAEISVGNEVTLSYGAKLITGGLVVGNEGSVHGHHQAKPVYIKDSVWIGAGAIILPGVSVETGAVVAAGSVVTCNVDPYTVMAGIPARVVHKLKREA